MPKRKNRRNQGERSRDTFDSSEDLGFDSYDDDDDDDFDLDDEDEDEDDDWDA